MAAITLLHLKEYPSHLLELVFKEDATAYDLFSIAIACAVFWFLFFSVAGRIFTRLTYGKPWLRAMMERECEQNKEMIENGPWSELPRETLIDEMMKAWPYTQVVMFQHVVGSMLCLPSLLGKGDPSWASSLAVLGLFSEMGFEIEDFFVNIIYVRFFTKDGKQKLPNVMLVFLLVHHSLATLLGIPMALHYRGLRALHWLIFDLQIAGATAPFTEYSKTLDISKSKELQQFKFLNFFMLIVFGWTRFVHFFYLIGQVVLAWYRDEAWLFMAYGALPVLGFCLLNLFIVISTYKRYMKFRKVSAEHESLPLDVSDEKRRRSMAGLKRAASTLTETEEQRAADLVASFLESLEHRKVGGRRSMPDRKMIKMASMRPAVLVRGATFTPTSKVD